MKTVSYLLLVIAIFADNLFLSAQTNRDTSIVSQILGKANSENIINIISENSNQDSIQICANKSFSGIIDSYVIFQDTVKIIGDVIIETTGNLLIKAGTYVEFQDHFKIKVFGKLNALGSKENRITFNAVDTSTYILSGFDHIVERGWAGIGFYNISNDDTLQLNYCNIYNVGIKEEGIYFEYKSPISIINSSNIFINNCLFRSNHSWFGNCGVFLK